MRTHWVHPIFPLLDNKPSRAITPHPSTHPLPPSPPPSLHSSSPKSNHANQPNLDSSTLGNASRNGFPATIPPLGLTHFHTLSEMASHHPLDTSARDWCLKILDRAFEPVLPSPSLTHLSFNPNSSPIPHLVPLSISLATQSDHLAVALSSSMSSLESYQSANRTLLEPQPDIPHVVPPLHINKHPPAAMPSFPLITPLDDNTSNRPFLHLPENVPLPTSPPCSDDTNVCQIIPLVLDPPPPPLMPSNLPHWDAFNHTIPFHLTSNPLLSTAFSNDLMSQNSPSSISLDSNLNPGSELDSPPSSIIPDPDLSFGTKIPDPDPSFELLPYFSDSELPYLAKSDELPPSRLTDTSTFGPGGPPQLLRIVPVERILKRPSPPPPSIAFPLSICSLPHPTPRPRSRPVPKLGPAPLSPCPLSIAIPSTNSLPSPPVRLRRTSPQPDSRPLISRFSLLSDFSPSLDLADRPLPIPLPTTTSAHLTDPHTRQSQPPGLLTKPVPRPPKPPLKKKEMLADHYCCFAIPLYGIGIHVILAQFAVLGLVSGILTFSTPAVLAIAVPGSLVVIFGVLCILIALVQGIGFYGVYKERVAYFKKYVILNVTLVIGILSYSLIIIILSATRHQTAIQQCLLEFVSNEDNLAQPSNSGKQICNIWTWAQLGVCGLLWTLLSISELYFCILQRKWAKDQKIDHLKYRSIVSAARTSMAITTDSHGGSSRHTRGASSISTINSTRPLNIASSQPNQSSRLRNEIEWKELSESTKPESAEPTAGVESDRHQHQPQQQPQRPQRQQFVESDIEFYRSPAVAGPTIRG